MSVLPGTRLGPYEILEKLGEGGMGEVYRGRDVRLGREVAIKVLSEGLQLDEHGLARFEREARAASALNHPNIVTVHDVGTLDGRPYMVLELIRGETLRKKLAGRRPLPVRETLSLAAQAAEALARAHAAGIVHRDLKPENLMVTADGYLKILDFGLAKWVAPREAVEEPTQSDAGTIDTIAGPAPAEPTSEPGTLLGTVGYMAPEQIRSSSVDFRADQFALGAILYELATGRRAFDAPTRTATLQAILREEPVSILAMAPSFPPPARWILERCLAKDPASRYASTLDLARELATVRDHLDETSSAASGTTTRSTRPPRGWRGTRVVAGALAVLAVGALLGVLSGRISRPALPDERQLVVLPFRNVGGDAEDQVFCDGLIETLASRLTQLERFHGSYWVVPASEVRQSGSASVVEARQRLGATMAITGSVQRAGAELQLTANLVDAATLRQLRAISLSSPVAELTRLQDGLVRRVGEMLELEIGGEEERLLDAGRTTSAGAYDAYLRGRGHLLDYQSAERLEAAIREFQAALQRDPDYALAYAGLGEAYWRQYELARDPEMVELARRSCERAVAENDLLAPVHVTLGLVHRGTGDPERALGDFERALALDPGNGQALSELARTLAQLGRREEAEATHRRALALRPGSWSGHNMFGSFLYQGGRYEEAAAEFQRVTEIAPDNPRGFSNLGGVLQPLGRFEEARAALARAVALQPTALALSNLGTLEFGLGRYPEAARAFARAIENGPRDYRLWQNLAAAYHWAPETRPRAAAAYEQAVELAREREAVDPRDLTVQSDLAECEAMLGRLAEARARIARVLAEEPDDPAILSRAAGIFERSGQRDEALRWLGAAFAAGLAPNQVEVDPGFAELRRDPRYQALVAGGTPPGDAAPGKGR